MVVITGDTMDDSDLSEAETEDEQWQQTVDIIKERLDALELWQRNVLQMSRRSGRAKNKRKHDQKVSGSFSIFVSNRF